MAFSFKHGDAEWTKLRKRSLDDLFWFCSVVLGYSDLFPLEEETHRLFCDFLQRKTGVPDLDLAPIQKLEMPRGTGKTTCGTVGHAIQLACANPNTAILIANERQETADGFLAAIKSQFETNDLLRALFPEVVPPDFKATTWAASKATLVRSSHRPEPTFMTIGVGGTVTGTHPDIIIVDDPISKEAMENARVGAWQIMERVNRWCNALKLLLNTQAQPFPQIRFNGTRWYQNDTYDYIENTFGGPEEMRRTYRLSAKLPSGVTVSREAYRVGQMSVFRAAAIEEGAPVFPKIHGMEKLAELRAEDPELFSCNMMNDPTSADVRTFQDPWLVYYDRMDNRVGAPARMFHYKNDNGSSRHVHDDNLRKVMVVDPAFTATGSGARAAIIVTGTDVETNRHLVLEAKAQRAEPRDLVIDILNTAKQHGITTIYIESVAQQAAFLQFVQNEARSRNMPLVVEPVKPSGRNKDLRIESLSAFFKARQILLHKSQLDLLREYESFPKAKYKDLLDALAYAAEKWPFGGIGQSARARSQAQYNDYLAKRGMQTAT
jgi:predicted phage terminase large subunit-like protein